MRTADNLGQKLAFKQVTERPMSHIMQKSYKNEDKVRNNFKLNQNHEQL